MKNILSLLSLLLFAASLQAQTGANCQQAIPLGGSTAHAQLDAGSLWFKFVAPSAQLALRLSGPDFALDTAHAHGLAIYDGSCPGPVLLGKRILAQAPGQNSISFGLEAGDFVPLATYYVEVQHDPLSSPCPKSACLGGSAPISLQLVALDVLVPADPEPMLASHAYAENRGQLLGANGLPANDIAFYTQGANPTVFAADAGISLVWLSGDSSATTPDSIHRIDLSFPGSQPATWLKSSPQPGHNNYYLAHAPDGVEDNHAYGRVIQSGIYPGVDLHLLSNADGLKLCFSIAPGAVPEVIRLRFDGAQSAQVLPSGGLGLRTLLGNMNFNKAAVYQLGSGGSQLPLPGSGAFMQFGSTEFGISVQQHDPNLPVVIVITQEPVAVSSPATVLPAWGTFYKGPDSHEACIELDTDELGNLYAVGYSYSVFFPLQNGFQILIGGYKDGYASKFNEYYVREFTTFIGGSESDEAVGVDADAANGRVYVCGTTNVGTIGWPVYTSVASQFGQAYPQAGFNTGFLASLDRTTGSRLWSTLFGGGNSACLAVESDATGNLYVVGSTYETNLVPGAVPTAGYGFPLTAPSGAYLQTVQNTFNGSNGGDGYIASFNPQGQLVWSTLFGGDKGDALFDLAIDEFYQRLYVVGGGKSSFLGGSTFSTPCTYMPMVDAGGYYQPQPDGNLTGGDGLIARFSLSGALQWSSYFGGAGYEAITGITTTSQPFGINPDGVVYITGRTNTTGYDLNCTAPNTGGFPGCTSGNKYFQPAYGGGATDAFIARFSIGTQLQWSTYLGGSGDDTDRYAGMCPGPRIGSRNSGEVYVGGSTSSGSNGSSQMASVPVAQLYNQSLGHADAASTVLKADGYVIGFNWLNQMDYMSHFGGQGNDYNHGLALFTDKVYVGGVVQSTGNYPLYNPVSLPGTAYFEGYPILSGSDIHYAQLQTGAIVASGQPIVGDGMFSLYPNPAKHEIHVRGNGAEIQSASVFDALGHEVMHLGHSIPQQEFTLPLADLPQGLYIVHCTDMEGNTSAMKFIKE